MGRLCGFGDPAGSGSEADPYRLKDAAETEMVCGKGKRERIQNDFYPLRSFDGRYRSGRAGMGTHGHTSYSDYVRRYLNGNGKSSDLHIDTNEQYQALFGYVKGEKTAVRNLEWRALWLPLLPPVRLETSGSGRVWKPRHFGKLCK